MALVDERDFIDANQLIDLQMALQRPLLLQLLHNIHTSLEHLRKSE